MKKEEWRDIPNFENLYQISNLGRIRRMPKGKILKLQMRNNYLVIQLTKNKKRKTYQISRLVAETFIRKPNDNEVVNHIDYNTKNNCVENLEWCTQKENVQHSIEHLKKPKKSRLPKSGFKYIQVRNNGKSFEVSVYNKYYGRFSTLKEALAKRDEVMSL